MFQRTPNFVVETTNDAVTDEQMQWLRDNYDEIYEKAANHPFGVAMEPAQFSALEVSAEQRRAIFESKWNEGGFHFANECFNDLATNLAASELASEFIRAKIREIVKDPATADLLCPKTYRSTANAFPPGTATTTRSTWTTYIWSTSQSTPITAITPTGVRVGDTEFELDVLIFATGFDAMTGTLTNIDIIGRDGITLRDNGRRGPAIQPGY